MARWRILAAVLAGTLVLAGCKARGLFYDRQQHRFDPSMLALQLAAPPAPAEAAAPSTTGELLCAHYRAVEHPYRYISCPERLEPTIEVTRRTPATRLN